MNNRRSSERSGEALRGPLPIVHVISGLRWGGAEMMLLKLVSRMDRGRFENSVVSLTGGGALKPRFESAGIRVHELSMENGWRTVSSVSRLLTLLRRSRPAILQGWMYHANLVSLVVGGILGIPIVAWNIRCSRMETRHYSAVSGAMFRGLGFLARYPDLVIFNSKAGEIDHRMQNYRPRRWTVIGNGFDSEEFKPEPSSRAALRQSLGLASDACLVGMVARFDPMKDYGNLLRAARRVVLDRPYPHFVLVGENVDWANEILGAEIRSLQLERHVHLLGLRQDIPFLLQALDLLVLSSVGEGFPNVVGEAMMSGIPCVATDVGDCRDLLGDCGRVVPCRDPEALSEAILSILCLTPGERLDLGKRARDRITEDYSIQRIVQEYEVTYSRLNGGSVKRSPAPSKRAIRF